jgi:peptidyl-prolyl cis-trans isomerase B (cyclophilin B)
VIDGFMIQGGALTPGMTEKTGRSPIENEADNGLSNDTGTLAMARTSDPHSASSQFFINVADNDFLNHTGKNPEGWGYAVFGKVTDGMDVVERIKGVTTTHMSYRHDVPYETVEIRKVTISDAYSEK